MWAEIYDEGSQRYYYFKEATGEVTWDRPDDFGNSSTEEISQIEDSDWEELLDESSGKYYYINNSTGATQWEEPEGFRRGQSVDTVQEFSSNDVLPAGWIEVPDPSTGKSYYYNELTNETSWDKPAPDAAAPASEESQNIPSGAWVEAAVEGTGQIYFYNTETGETSWDRPAAMSPPLSRSDSRSSIASFSRESSAENVSVQNTSAASSEKDKMSLYHPSNLHLPEYSRTEEGGGQHQQQSSRNKRSGFVSAPDEFAADFLAVHSHDDARSHLRGQQKSGDGSDDFGQSAEVAEALDYLEAIDWTEINPSQLSDSILGMREAQMSAPHVLAYLAKRLQSFTIASFAEAYFQFDRRGSQIPANMIDKLISFQIEPLKAPLTILPSTLAGDALQCFRHIQSFMGRSVGAKQAAQQITRQNTAANSGQGSNNNNSYSSHADTSAYMEIAAYLIQKMAMAPSELSDEVYLQLCKQTRRNPSAEATELGWQLFLILLTSIPVSRRLLPYLLQYVAVAVENLVDEAKKFAALCLRFVLPSAVSSPRRELPTEKEIHALLLGESMDIRIKCVDKKILVVSIDSFTTVRVLENTVQQTLKVAPVNRTLFGLYELRGGRDVTIAPTDRVCDILSAWAANSRNLADAILSGDHGLETGNSFIVDENLIPRFVFRVKYFFSVQDEDDQVTLDLLYAQALHDCSSAHYPHTLQDALLLSAFQLQILNGDFIVGKEIREFRNTSSIRTLCVAPWLEKEEITRAEAEAKITGLYKKLISTSRMQARNMFLKYVQSWKLYGARYFLVKGQQQQQQLDLGTSSGVNSAPGTISATSSGSGASHELILAVNPRSVVVIVPTYCSFLADYAFDQIHSWGHSFDSFALAVGTKESQTKSYFRTAQGKEIEELLRIYTTQSLKHSRSLTE